MMLAIIAMSLIGQSRLGQVSLAVSGPSAASKGYPLEFTVDTGRVYDNPFDPDEVSVHGVFEHVGRPALDVPAFWDGKSFRIRFAPPVGGHWSLRVEDGEHRSAVQLFHVSALARDGFLRVSPTNGRYFQLDSGKSFVPIGLNLCWPDKSGVSSYDERFAKLKSVGGNFSRIWCTQEKRLETKLAGLGRYDLDSAAYYDEVLGLAAKHGIRVMLTFDDYRILAKTDYFNAHWDQSPYNKANGGPLREPTDFFADPYCQKLYKRRLRYLVARYGAYSSLGIWELYNEQDNIPKPGVPIGWFREMTSYLASIDPYRHPITTSYSWDDKSEVWQSPAVALTQRHLYGQGDTIDFVSMIRDNSRKLDRFDKPHLIGEFGITWKEPDIALDKARKGTPLHDALWASIMTGDAGGAMTWWWDNYLEPLNLWPTFEGISRFVAGIDFAHKDFRPFEIKVDGLTALGMRDAKSGETILWLHDPNSTWKADADGVQPRKWQNVEVQLPETRAMNVEVWDTRLGNVVQRLRSIPANLKLPTFARDIALHLKN